jgi:hypothetical protein
VKSSCATTLEVTRVRRAPLQATDARLAVAASGPYASELLGGTRAALEGRLAVESCVLGCPGVGLYASVTLTPGPQEGRTPRTCQAEVYTGKSWAAPEAVRGTFVRTVDDVDACLVALRSWLLEPRREMVRVRFDETAAPKEVVVLVRTGRFDEAVVPLEALAARPGASAGAWFNLGLVHEARGRREEAGRCYGRAASLAPPSWMKSALDDFAASAP